LTAKLSATYLSALNALRDEAALLLLIVVGTLVYAGSVLSLFGRGWLRSLVRG
jgi:putative peptidoglycan lipid II flippase